MTYFSNHWFLFIVIVIIDVQLSKQLSYSVECFTVKSAYKEPAYYELPVIRNWISFPNL